MQANTLTDTEVVDWLDHWLVSFSWSRETQLCGLVFKDPYEHQYAMTGKSLRECVANAVTKHPTSLTFMKGETR
jgi:hypothetical protein